MRQQMAIAMKQPEFYADNVKDVKEMSKWLSNWLLAT